MVDVGNRQVFKAAADEGLVEVEVRLTKEMKMNQVAFIAAT